MSGLESLACLNDFIWFHMTKLINISHFNTYSVACVGNKAILIIIAVLCSPWLGECVAELRRVLARNILPSSNKVPCCRTERDLTGLGKSV